jgi:hypothetical protein
VSPCLTSRQDELPLANGRVNGRQQLAAEERHDDPRGQQKPVSHGHPVAGAAQAPTGHETVEMRRQELRLALRMQRGHDARRGPQILRIAQQL